MGETEIVLENLVEILLLACVVAMAVKRVHVPYTTALVLVGIAVSFLPVHLEVHLSKELVFLIILPPLLFQRALYMDLDQLRRHLLPIVTLAVPGLLVATLLMGAMVAATDPISVLAIFREVETPDRLKVLVEGESLFNDGTSVVLFGVIYGALYGGTEVTVMGAALTFLQVVIAGAVVGLGLGYVGYRTMQRLDDHLLEVTLTVVLVFGVSCWPSCFTSRESSRWSWQG